MSIIVFRDRAAMSPEGRFTLEARSSHNWGMDRHQDGGARLEDDSFAKYREDQCGFGYRLVEHVPGAAEPRVVWVRRQGRGELPPLGLWVSDDGWVVLRLHGFPPQVVAVEPSGREVFRVRVIRGNAELEDWEAHEPRGRVWRARNYDSGPAEGDTWARNSWSYFHSREGLLLFVCRTSMGQRLVLDLSGAALVGEDTPEWPALSRELDDAERRGVESLLAELTERRAEIVRDASQEKLGRIVAGLHLVGVHRIESCVPHLRRWEEVDRPYSIESSLAFGDGYSTWLERQTFRPVVQHALRVLGLQPEGHATYHFLDGGDDECRLPMLAPVTDRRARAAALHENMSAGEVLQLLGSPDDVLSPSREIGGTFHRTEDWDYDFLTPSGQWLTLKLAWEAVDGQGQLISIQEAPAVWLYSDDRVRRFLDR